MLEVSFVAVFYKGHVDDSLGSRFDAEVKYNTITEKKIDYMRAFVPGL